MNTIVIYCSKYGSSRQYAKWIADALGCEANAAEIIAPNSLNSFEVIIYVGGIYAGRINGFKKFSRHFDNGNKKQWLLCIVGFENPINIDKYKKVYENNVPEQYRSTVKPFALRGDLLWSKMNLRHKIMMKVPKALAEKISEADRTEDDKYFLENYGLDMQFSSKSNIVEIVNYVKESKFGYCANDDQGKPKDRSVGDSSVDRSP